MAIRLCRSDRYAVHLVFGRSDVDTLIDAFRSATSGQSTQVAIEYDPGTIREKRYNELLLGELSLAAVAEEQEEEVQGDLKAHLLVLRLHTDTLEYGLGKLRECKRTGSFEPAELCELRVGKRRDANELYCIIREEPALRPEGESG